MKSSPITCLLLGVVAVVLSAGPAQAQIGGFLKKKAKEAAQAPIKQEQARQQADEAAANALSTPDIVPITGESTARFRTALGTEARLRGELRAQLASVKSQEEYNACSGELIMSPEAQKISMRLADMPANASAADLQKLMMKTNADLEALVTKRCGPNPSQWNPGKVSQRLQEIEGEASDALAPPGAAVPDLEASAERRAGPSAHAAEPWQAEAHPYRRKYALLKERWIPFCGALTEAALKGDGKYRTVKGVGSGVYVYSSSEAEVMTASCAAVMDDLNHVLEAVSGPKR
jgi:hypothetical protein